MIDILKIETFEELEQHYERIAERIYDLSMEVIGSKTSLTKSLKKERYEKLSSLRNQIKKLESVKDEEYYQKIKEMEEKRQQLYQERDLKLAELQKENEPKEEEVHILQEDKDAIVNVKDSISLLRMKKTNEEWLNIIKALMEEKELVNYSIQILDRIYTVVGMGTHSEKIHFTESRTGTIVAVVKDGYDMSSVPEQVFSYPEENPEFFKNHDFILYEVFDTSLSGNLEYLMKKNSVKTLFGMPDSVTKSIDNMLFEEYKNHVISQNKVIKI